MKKVLILIIVILLGFGCYNLVKDGIQIAGFSILGIAEIQAENSKLDVQLDEIEQINGTLYPAMLSQISSASKELQSAKKTYEELVAYSSEQDVLNASQSERYDIEVLWTRVGNHATSNGVIPKMDIVSSANNTPNANDLKFTATGNYIALTDFIRDIEEDSKLGFAIENFEMIPVAESNGTELQASFRVTDIFINSDTITSFITPEEDETTENTEETKDAKDTKNAGQ